MSEYGCTKNGRDFGEVQALMSDEMTSVYSGGLMYEYAMEDNGFGIASIPSPEATTVKELSEFSKFASALSANPAPTGDGGFTSTTKSVACPTKDANWLVDTTLLPAIPDNAKKVRGIYLDVNQGGSIMLTTLLAVHVRGRRNRSGPERRWIAASC